MKKLSVMLSFMLSVSVWAAGATLPQVEITFDGVLSSTMTEYVYGQVVMHEEGLPDVTLPACFKTRGATSKHYSKKPSLNMKLRQLQADGTELEIDSSLLRMRSVSSWILDAMAIDRIQMRNRVAFDVWNEFSHLPYPTQFGSRNGTEGQFVELTINGTYKGIYCLSDKINRKLLDLKKPSVDAAGNVTIRGAIYKHGTNDLGDQNTVGYFNDYATYVIAWHDAWELSEPDDYPCLAAWDALNTLYDNHNDLNWIKSHFYLSQLAEYQIFIIGLAINDNWGAKNSYVSIRNMRDTGERNTYIYTPWDLDTSLGGRYDGRYYNGTYTEWPVASAMAGSNMPVPFSKLSGDPEYKTELRNAWIRGSRQALSVEAVSSRLMAYRDLFLESGAWSRQVANPNGAQLCTDLTAEIDLIIAWYANRFAEMDAYFGVTDADRQNYTDLETVSAEPTAQKFFRDGQLLIRRGSHVFTAQGQLIK